MRRRKQKPASQIIHAEGISLPINIYLENRNNSRVSLGKRAVHIRFPFWLSRKEKEQQLRQFLDWVRTKLVKKAASMPQEKARQYWDGDQLQVGSDQYLLHIDYKDRKTGTAIIKGSEIHIIIPKGLTYNAQINLIATLIGRCLSAHYLPWISGKVRNLNQKYFKQQINRISLKNTRTRWGSCSQKGNINLSTRILFAPEEVIDYVCVHELAHLIIPNHSKKFWNLVESGVPDYKKHIQWLKKNESKCRL